MNDMNNIFSKNYRDSALDQAYLRDMIEDWRQENNGDEFFLRLKPTSDHQHLEISPSLDILEDDITTAMTSQVTHNLLGNRDKFLFVHQTTWQRELLARYGNELCLLDATYRTSRYSLPLYFLVVPTNVNYMVVASFITETEDSVSISEALKIIRGWNSAWKPKYFLTDYAEEEISAIESTFHGK